MTSHLLGPALATALVALFTASAFAKVGYWEETREWCNELFPKLRPTVSAAAVVAVEVAIAAGIVLRPAAGAMVAVGWLLAASAVLWSGRRRVASCGCFGRRQQLGPGVALRNGAATATAAAAAFLAEPGTPLPAEVGLSGALAGVAVVVWREALDRRGVVV